MATSKSDDSGALRASLSAAKEELTMLHAALDNVESGLLILDSDLRAVYSNPAVHKLFKNFTAQQIRQEKPLYVDLLKAAAQVSAVQLKNYVAQRLKWVQSGSTTPMDLHMGDGAILRCHIAVLPNGGRMLIYSDVTDIVKSAEKMERLATIDGMTGIFNRRHFLTLADHEWRRSRRYHRNLSFLMIDIDHFKSINDSFGHQIGDEVIIHIAKLAEDCKRDSDLLARIGGEEFALLLPETDGEQAIRMAERLRSSLSETPRCIDATRPLTVSIGIATATKEMQTISDLMKAADQALYDAKRSGRNRVICFSSVESPSLAPKLDPIDRFQATVKGK